MAWLGWGDQARYSTWQVAGCALTGIAATVILCLLCRWRRSGPVAVGLGGFLGFTTAWAVWAGGSDSTGLWGVGYLMLAVGVGAVEGVLVALAAALLVHRHPPRTSLP